MPIYVCVIISGTDHYDELLESVSSVAEKVSGI